MMAKEWLDDEQIWLVLFHQFTRASFIRGKSADCIAQIPPHNRNESFSGDGAVVSDDHRSLWRGERCGEDPHKTWRVAKNSLDDKKIP